MKVYLVGFQKSNIRDHFLDNTDTNYLYSLESFYHIDKKFSTHIHRFKDFMLDSGAYTFLTTQKKSVNWDDYITRYAEFINEYNVKKFFELDIDNIAGLKEVERLREKLETLTNKKCIPVWHISRGLDYYKNLSSAYTYIAIGGLVTKEITKAQYKHFPHLISMARQRGAKVHGLGFTGVPLLKTYKFDSVDSSTWSMGEKFGFLFKFDNGRMVRLTAKEINERINNEIGHRRTSIHNFAEWIKFQTYAEIFL